MNKFPFEGFEERISSGLLKSMDAFIDMCGMPSPTSDPHASPDLKTRSMSQNQVQKFLGHLGARMLTHPIPSSWEGPTIDSTPQPVDQPETDE